jgi:3-phenylpropionate/trans-cinnamate dioxygenase ferredoxin subunit
VELVLPHRPVKLDERIERSNIECPKHNGRFDYTSGKALGAPVLSDIRAYHVKVMD